MRVDTACFEEKVWTNNFDNQEFKNNYHLRILNHYLREVLSSNNKINKVTGPFHSVKNRIAIRKTKNSIRTW